MARHEVQTPIPGVFYRRPSPDEDEFVQTGDSVETGATIKVPLYLEIGETIKIDTRTRAFVERVR